MKNKEILIFDGAMGTILLKNGIKKGESSEIFGFNNKEIILNIHKSYLDAGCDIITTNTFLANKLQLNDTNYSLEEIVRDAIYVAKEAIKDYENKFIALDIGPIIMNKYNLSEKEAYELFKEVALLGEKYNVDLILLETMMSLKEMKIGIKACKENTKLPVFCSMTFDREERSLDGNTVEKVISEINKLDIDAFGINCSFGAKESLKIVEKICKLSNKKVIAIPNAGIPKAINNDFNNLIYENNEDEFLYYIKKYIDLGVSFVGGCCGTTPSYIKKISDYIKNDLLNK